MKVCIYYQDGSKGPWPLKITKPIKKITLEINECRFWPKVKKSDGCWEWQGKPNPDGYGAFYLGRDEYGKRRSTPAHRASWLIHHGEIPVGLEVLHTCDVRHCVRPDHLFLGTQKQNIQDALAKGRMATGDRHGQRLHPESVARGEHSGKSKLTEEQVREIRYLKNVKRIKAEVLADRFGVYVTRIYKIANGSEWKHVQDEVFA